MKAETQIAMASLALCATLACGSPQPQRDSPLEGLSLDELRTEILAAQGSGRCERTAQCRAIPLGAKPCGGPRSYLVHSTLTADTARLASLVETYTRREAELNEQEGRMSDCMFVQPPHVECVNDRCVTGR